MNSIDANTIEILNHRQILQKVRRLAIEIMERNTKEHELIVAGVNNRGMHFATLLVNHIRELSDAPIRLTNIQVNPANPVSEEVTIGLDLSDLDGKPILVVDDVANTGRTLFYACKPLLDILPKQLETAVLVDRTHKSFPIQVDYHGMSLATTLKESIEVYFEDEENYRAVLK
ncbi:phosphoribosyltransferase family protein [Lewinella cohaerens]|uniref:phosphoribosyltransferase family protein n=1 Tax=Lewinella cohaerens TaxID=70995 RepID=UPI00036FC3E3|nr:phosphoribosyltransferase family protein [Lewinella cohaerens]